MTEYEKTKIRDLISSMTAEEKQIAREVLAEEESDGREENGKK